ncbi:MULTISPECIES: hypothetical protein [Streptomyces]|uniref:hypothetical protein n=1 Tax=Streptomyces TaxID=1883 RepID=UPI00125098C3|nr:hypothetical protein [Streptomyces sp. SS1-1]KAB2976682.1 hypothetical protein F8R89_34530 [Streptomyces sp. SS1-1]
MNTTPRLKKAISRMPRTLAVTTAVGIACAAGLATAAPAMAAPATHAAVQAAPAGGGEDQQCGNGLLVLLNFCN